MCWHDSTTTTSRCIALQMDLVWLDADIGSLSLVLRSERRCEATERNCEAKRSSARAGYVLELAIRGLRHRIADFDHRIPQWLRLPICRRTAGSSCRVDECQVARQVFSQPHSKRRVHIESSPLTVIDMASRWILRNGFADVFGKTQSQLSIHCRPWTFREAVAQLEKRACLTLSRPTFR